MKLVTNEWTVKPQLDLIEVGERFLFGYGLDYKGYWSNAPGIYAVKGV